MRPAPIVLAFTQGVPGDDCLTASAIQSVKELRAEKEIATELEQLGREVKRLHAEIRGSAIPLRGHSAMSHPAFPTESERRLRPLDGLPDHDRSSEEVKGAASHPGTPVDGENLPGDVTRRR